MRHIDKGDAPAELGGDAETFQQEALSFALGGNAPTFESNLKKHAVRENGVFRHYASALFTANNYYGQKPVKRSLIVSHFGKCVFCESFIMDVDVGDVEHFRPKAAVSTRGLEDPHRQVDVDHPGYFWLSQTWSNLFLSCRQCNESFKKNFFDLLPETARALPNAPGVGGEEPLLLTPDLPDKTLRTLIRFDPATARVLENPEALFGPLPERAKSIARIGRTIDIAGLNRPRLVEARAHHLVKLRSLFSLVVHGGALAHDNVAPDVFRFQTAPDTPSADAYLALRRATLPSAEYSALALDAIHVWNGELQVEARAINVAQQQQNILRFAVSPPRLNAQIALAENTRQANAASSEDEAAPDLTKLDQAYAEVLGKYKIKVRKINKDRQAFTAAREAVNRLRTTYNQRYAGSLLQTVQNRFDELDGRRRWMIHAAGGSDQAANARYGSEFLRVTEEMGQIHNRLHSGDLAPAVQAQRTSLEEINFLELPLDQLWGEILDIHEDVVDLAAAYRRAGAGRAERLDRVDALSAALDHLAHTVHGDAQPNQTLQNHLAGRGWPPAIRE
jgi:hypothetical protein